MNRKSGQVLRRIFVVVVLCVSFLPGLAMPAVDTIMKPASEKYHHPSLLNVILLGRNYRNEWAMPVALPVFDLKSTGLRITELGGGMQTKSLYFKDKQGEEWVLRTVDKDPTEAVPKYMRNRFTTKVVQQMISAQHPYGAVTISTLGKAAGIKCASPKYYWVPDDAGFGKHQEVFANKLCLFERKNIVADAGQAIETQDLIPNLLLHNSYQVDQEKYLRARLLDMLIGDWDRHHDQWLWLPVANKGRMLFEALPKDRDQAYFHANGLLVKFVRLFTMKHLVGFSESTGNIRRLNFKEWNMDRLFTNELTEADWRRIVGAFTATLTDTVINNAVAKLPAQIEDEKIREKLLSRRNELAGDVLRYYKFVARKVIINGSDDAETIHISGNRDSVVITMNGYKRTFYRTKTKEVQVFLLGGDDNVVCEAAATAVRVNIDAGSGNDRYATNKVVKVVDNDMDARKREKEMRAYLKIRD